MRKGFAKVAAIGVLAAVPAIAFADSTTYSDETMLSGASIKLKLSDGGNREVKKVIANELPYLSVSQGCPPVGGNTGKIVVRDGWNVNGKDRFRVVGQFDGGGNPLDAGQLNVVGKAGANKVTGDVKFTYGKTGCTTVKLDFTAKK